jgi:hypothetical protein
MGICSHQSEQRGNNGTASHDTTHRTTARTVVHKRKAARPRGVSFPRRARKESAPEDARERRTVQIRRRGR